MWGQLHDTRFTKQLSNITRGLPGWLAHRWAYTLVFIPVVAEWLDKAHPPTELFELIKTGCLSAVIGICIWRLYRDSTKLKYLSETDMLTGLYNRRRFTEDLEGETTRSRRLHIPLSLLYIDVDNFKQFNDTHGHAKGDRVLSEVALFLKQSTRRQMDSCYRIGGDEFAVLMPGAHASDAILAMRRRRDDAAMPAFFSRDNVHLSVGAVELNGDSPSELVKQADRYMYAAKRGEAFAANEKMCFAKI